MSHITPKLVQYFLGEKAVQETGNVQLGLFQEGALLGVALFGYPRNGKRREEYSSELFGWDNCPIHGETKFRKKCIKCSLNKVKA